MSMVRIGAACWMRGMQEPAVCDHKELFAVANRAKSGFRAIFPNVSICRHFFAMRKNYVAAQQRQSRCLIVQRRRVPHAPERPEERTRMAKNGKAEEKKRVNIALQGGGSQS